jgi:hypothetical protein
MLILMVVQDAIHLESLLHAKIRRIFEHEWDMKGFGIETKNELTSTYFIPNSTGPWNNSASIPWLIRIQ